MGWTGCSPARIVWKDYQQHPEKQPMHIETPVLASIGIDIGKKVFHIVGFGADGKIAFRRKIKRSRSWIPLESCHHVWSAWRHASAHTLSAGPASAGPPTEDHPYDLREAVREGAEERLQ